jgi:hypothetical protein
MDQTEKYYRTKIVKSGETMSKIYSNSKCSTVVLAIALLGWGLLLNSLGTPALRAAESQTGSSVYLPQVAGRRSDSLNTPAPPPTITSTPPTTTPTAVTPEPTPVPDGLGNIVFGQDRFLEAADVATDGAGNIHYLFNAVSSNDQTGKGWQYAFCAAFNTDCADPQQWRLTDLGRTDALAQLEVTVNGLPRIWFKSTLSARPTFSYGECNNSCNQKANWQFVDVVTTKYTYPSLEELGFRHESFALDPQGRPRFVYFHADYDQPDIHGIRYAFCNNNCTSLDSWDSARISSSQSLWRPALGFTPAGQPRIVASDLSDNKRMMYVQCNADCEGAGLWSSVALFEQSADFVAWSFKVDPANGAIRVAYKQNTDPDMWFVWCNGDCLTIENWDGVSLVLTNAPGGRHPALALDPQGRPHIAYEYVGSSRNGLGYLRCTSDCYTLSTAHTGVWEDTVVEDNVTLLEEYPLAVPGGCKDPAWLTGLRPVLALDSQGRARFVFEADGYNYCNKGTLENPSWVYGQYWGTSRLIFER